MPPSLQTALGGAALTGNAALAVIARTSLGPSVASFNPLALSDALELVSYPLAHPSLGPWGAANAYFGSSDSVKGVAVPERFGSVLFFGRHGATFCYGESTPDPSLAGTTNPADGATYCNDPTSMYKGTHGYPYSAYVWMYDINDLIAVRTGHTNPWDIRPAAVWTLPQLITANVGGAAYDPATKRLFISEMFREGSLPIVHVYLVQ